VGCIVGVRDGEAVAGLVGEGVGSLWDEQPMTSAISSRVVRCSRDTEWSHLQRVGDEYSLAGLLPTADTHDRWQRNDRSSLIAE
jgi:hypothetical protein